MRKRFRKADMPAPDGPGSTRGAVPQTGAMAEGGVMAGRR